MVRNDRFCRVSNKFEGVGYQMNAEIVLPNEGL
ncbi:hypothetical protein A2U01_0068193, partial [Trifolium medium]|nr:hypothetical protein [Trifolium medium]